MLQGLADKDFGHDKLVAMPQLIDAEKSDLFDVLAYVAYAMPPLGSGDEHDETIQPECEAAVWRCAEAERFENMAELHLLLFCIHAKHGEEFGLEIALVDADGTAAKFDAVEHDIVGDGDAYDLSTGALETLVRNESLSTNNLTEGGRLNLLSPAEHDPAPFQNGVLLHSARATAIGLTSAKPTFRYRAVTRGTYADLTSLITFNAAQPIIDPTPYGLDHTPVFDEGTDVKFDLNRGNAAGTTTVKALVLHQHNLSGKHHEVVTLNLSTADTDGDGLPDAWELAHFGDLSFTGADDPDGDGVNNATEFARGTDPFKLRFLAPVTKSNPPQWFSPTGRYFTMERTTNLATGFQTLQRHILTVPGTNTFLDFERVAGGGPFFFYRLRAE